MSQATDAPPILIVDDDENLRWALVDLLHLKGYAPVAASSGADALVRATEQMPALALIDLQLGDMLGLDVLAWIKERSPDTECIVLTGHASRSSAIEAINLGAYSYIEKPYALEQLLITIQRAIQKRETERALRERELQHRRLLEQQIVVNQLALLLGESRDLDKIYRTIYDHVRQLMDAEVFVLSFYDSDTQLIHAGYGLQKDREIDVSVLPPIPLEKPGHGTQSQVIRTGQLFYVPDLRHRLEATQTKHTVTEEGTVVEGTPPKDTERFSNSALYVPMKTEGRTIGVMQVQSYRLDAYSQEDQDLLSALANVASIAIQNARLFRDLQDQMQTLRETQSQLIQAEKMSAVGQLAGGIAHDFNNLLTVIHLSTRMLERQIHPEDPLRPHVRRIQDAGRRASQLTKQLLSFSRQEVLEPKVLSLNQMVSDMHQMLKRLIREDVDLVLDLEAELWPVYADPSQVDQVIVNLVVNARDAMIGGGTLTIETTNVAAEDERARRPKDDGAGHWVLLAIHDTGVGMDEETQARIFEPFFTTKERGQGTGLGLATVYGIVQQSGGQIEVESEVGQGSIFRIYLPRAEGTLVVEEIPEAAVPVTREPGAETILLAEDDELVRQLTVSILKSSGYTVLAAASGPEALLISREHDGPIHLLLTDVIMPMMSGKELAERLKRTRPETRILYASGYTDDTIANHGLLEAGTTLLRKPFALEELIDKVREVMDD